jgi:hypothetical protein
MPIVMCNAEKQIGTALTREGLAEQFTVSCGFASAALIQAG